MTAMAQNLTARNPARNPESTYKVVTWTPPMVRAIRPTAASPQAGRLFYSAVHSHCNNVPNHRRLTAMNILVDEAGCRMKTVTCPPEMARTPFKAIPNSMIVNVIGYQLSEAHEQKLKLLSEVNFLGLRNPEYCRWCWDNGMLHILPEPAFQGKHSKTLPRGPLTTTVPAALRELLVNFHPFKTRKQHRVFLPSRKFPTYMIVHQDILYTKERYYKGEPLEPTQTSHMYLGATSTNTEQEVIKHISAYDFQARKYCAQCWQYGRLHLIPNYLGVEHSLHIKGTAKDIESFTAAVIYGTGLRKPKHDFPVANFVFKHPLPQHLNEEEKEIVKYINPDHIRKGRYCKLCWEMGSLHLLPENYQETTLVLNPCTMEIPVVQGYYDLYFDFLCKRRLHTIAQLSAAAIQQMTRQGEESYTSRGIAIPTLDLTPHTQYFFLRPEIYLKPEQHIELERVNNQ